MTVGTTWETPCHKGGDFLLLAQFQHLNEWNAALWLQYATPHVYVMSTELENSIA